METILITDSCSDLPLSFIEENNISALSFTCEYKGEERMDDFGKTFQYKEFYTAVRNGEMPKTSQVNANRYFNEFEKHVKQGKSVIYICFSSALSGSFNSANIAKDMILEEYENADITIIDSKCASMGEGLLFYYAYNMLKDGVSKEEIINWVENNKLKINHWFTVDDLNHLKRGGRVSSAAAVIGTILDIKPVLIVNDEGKLIPVGKVKGRKKSLRTLADKLEENIASYEPQVVFISHGDCLEDAVYVENLVRKNNKVKDVVINNVGPVVGTHSGPGTVALFFMGQKR